MTCGKGFVHHGNSLAMDSYQTGQVGGCGCGGSVGASQLGGMRRKRGGCGCTGGSTMTRLASYQGGRRKLGGCATCNCDGGNAGAFPVYSGGKRKRGGVMKKKMMKKKVLKKKIMKKKSMKKHTYKKKSNKDTMKLKKLYF